MSFKSPKQRKAVMAKLKLFKISGWQVKKGIEGGINFSRKNKFIQIIPTAPKTFRVVVGGSNKVTQLTVPSNQKTAIKSAKIFAERLK